VSTDPEHRFELALQLADLKTALSLAREAGSQQKWRQLSDLALSEGCLDLAQECLWHAQDYGGLLLLATSAGKLLFRHLNTTFSTSSFPSRFQDSPKIFSQAWRLLKLK